MVERSTAQRIPLSLRLGGFLRPFRAGAVADGCPGLHPGLLSNAPPGLRAPSGDGSNGSAGDDPGHRFVANYRCNLEIEHIGPLLDPCCDGRCVVGLAMEVAFSTVDTMPAVGHGDAGGWWCSCRAETGLGGFALSGVNFVVNDEFQGCSPSIRRKVDRSRPGCK